MHIQDEAGMVSLRIMVMAWVFRLKVMTRQHQMPWQMCKVHGGALENHAFPHGLTDVNCNESHLQLAPACV